MKTIVLALFLTAASAFAATHPSLSPATTNNDDSCDLALLPAATLLLPYFEVDYEAPASTATTTVFTITNVTQLPQIARVTIWTDLAFPVLTFNIFLTGYDLQMINLYDILQRGMIAPFHGTSNTTTPGDRSLANGANPRFRRTAAQNCASLPGPIPASVRREAAALLATGLGTACGETRVGLPRPWLAVGYVTIDVVGDCTPLSPADPGYFTNDLLFENVLVGDYAIIAPSPYTGTHAGAAPLVHIRAVPEGGDAGVAEATSLPYTFYDRLTGGTPGARTIDRRQPLPSAFAARFIEGGTFETTFLLWHEAVTGNGAACAAYQANAQENRVAEIVRFDEHENPTTAARVITPPGATLNLPATSSFPTSHGIFPPLATLTDDAGGWMYVNATNGGSPAYSGRGGRRPSQNWLVVSMKADERFGTLADAPALANGCTPAAALTSPAGDGTIGPGANQTP